MAFINYSAREINCKLVYYGPGLSGKTTNLEVVHKKAPASKKSSPTTSSPRQRTTALRINN